MKELVFSVKDIFNNETADGCLSQYDASFYMIPAYQRGYKWAADKHGAVTALMEDLWSAYIEEKTEYYLQYITLKHGTSEIADKSSDSYCLEVIDGQQRLTTLSILLSAFNALENNDEKKNPAADKLRYSIRPNLFKDWIYPAEPFLKFAQVNFNDLVEADRERFDRQDVYYLHAASSYCLKFLKKPQRDISGFYEFILSKVKLIVNSIEPHIKSETVFRNLNSNKVPLTEVELIKALLITRAGRGEVDNDSANFREVMEVRFGLGRQWDEIQSWVNDEVVRSFYFSSNSDPMYDLLKLTAARFAKVPDAALSGGRQSDKWLFDLYDRADARTAFNQLVETWLCLKDWFLDDKIYHLIGFIRFSGSPAKPSLQFLRVCLDMPSRSALNEKLISEKNSLIFGKNCEQGMQREALEALKYGEGSDQIRAILLSLSVFVRSDSAVRFDFYQFVKNKWSLEHIFPQNPEGRKNKLNSDDKDNIRKLLRASSVEIKPELESILEKEVRDQEDKTFVADKIKECRLVHGIGNMCLLTGGDNSVLGCGFFDEKRKKILHLVKQGNFVPAHSFDVFSKMIPGLEDDLGRWSVEDMKAHTKFILKSLCAEDEIQ